MLAMTLSFTFIQCERLEKNFLFAALTKDVDLTITNILEGRVQFVAEEPSSPTARLSTSSSPVSSPGASSSVRNYTKVILNWIKFNFNCES